MDPGDDAVPSRVAGGSGGACARRDGGGKGGDGVPVVSETTRVRPGGDVAPSRATRGGGGRVCEAGAAVERAAAAFRWYPGRRGCVRVVTWAPWRRRRWAEERGRTCEAGWRCEGRRRRAGRFRDDAGASGW